MTSNTILKSGLLGYSFGQIRMGVSSQKNTSSVIHFEKKIFVIFEKKQVIVSCKCRPAGSRLLLRLFIILLCMLIFWKGFDKRQKQVSPGQKSLEFQKTPKYRVIRTTNVHTLNSTLLDTNF